jgi:phage-related protein
VKEKSPFRPVYWMGDSLKVLRSFPEEAQDDIGHSLMIVQAGLTPLDSKPLTGIGSGVFEIVTRYDGDTYRTVYAYAAKIGNYVYVLHVFQKKSKSGIKTPQQEIDLIVKRLKEAQRREGEL